MHHTLELVTEGNATFSFAVYLFDSNFVPFASYLDFILFFSHQDDILVLS